MKGDLVVVDGKDGRRASFPDSFTFALSYLPGAQAYASLICTPRPFNQMLADVLFRALEGASFNMTDGSHNYTEVVKDHVIHRPGPQDEDGAEARPEVQGDEEGAHRIGQEGHGGEG
ncbi:MAG: hypothetical protein JRN12_06950 [Nitrososphaerota archaeon]|jgi:hypothetical protein|nr:hypothetical protein [Nitrososphaerota archaeon]MDG6987505.1 hypothetical protein [Nitrososphaerota archaeon]MDG6990149.1 hypothetical protein [Nitrososphaerota archaeon]MDG7006155.1 hypothetical protein [Nitrososphaerota archaeon]MDG7022803.1 hypothetical protein [Nitrososphaerota archaeon]